MTTLGNFLMMLFDFTFEDLVEDRVYTGDRRGLRDPRYSTSPDPEDSKDDADEWKSMDLLFLMGELFCFFLVILLGFFRGHA